MVMSLVTSEKTVGLHVEPALESLALRPLRTARDELGAFGDPLLDVAGHPIDLGLARQRAQARALGKGVAGLVVALDLVGGDSLGVGQALAGHEHAGERRAGLARVEVGLADAVAHRLLEALVVEVVEEDVGRLATELEGDPLDR